MNNSVQDWLPFDDIYEDGVIKLKNNNLIKIMKIIAINFNLKSDFEKQAILNSYKLFLKTCNFDMQILIQSNKEDLNKNISKIKNININETENIKLISNNYCEYITKLNKENKSSSKKFFILIKGIPEKSNVNNIKDELNNNYFKIKECLSRCGNSVYPVSTREEVEELIYSFYENRYKNM